MSVKPLSIQSGMQASDYITPNPQNILEEIELKKLVIHDPQAALVIAELDLVIALHECEGSIKIAKRKLRHILNIHERIEHEFIMAEHHYEVADRELTFLIKFAPLNEYNPMLDLVQALADFEKAQRRKECVYRVLQSLYELHRTAVASRTNLLYISLKIEIHLMNYSVDN